MWRGFLFAVEPGRNRLSTSVLPAGEVAQEALGWLPAADEVISSLDWDLSGFASLRSEIC